MRLRRLAWIASTGSGMALLGWLATGGKPSEMSAWESLASPGALSRAHTSLEGRCATCHEPYEGVRRASCVPCHAGNATLLSQASTKFHADIGSCRECHAEHRGTAARIVGMDHRALAAIALKDLERAGAAASATHLRAWLRARDVAERARASSLSREEALLDCAACHTQKDRHLGLFGSDCAACHGTSAWSIPRFRHPSANSVDCAQCHRPPPSHLMGHFEMVSMVVARKPHARVEECYRCHLTTAWNDIRDVGWYEHH